MASVVLLLQNYVKNLLDRAVVYMNVDLAVEGPTCMTARSVPILADLIYTVAKKVKTLIRTCTHTLTSHAR